MISFGNVLEHIDELRRLYFKYDDEKSYCLLAIVYIRNYIVLIKRDTDNREIIIKQNLLKEKPDLEEKDLKFNVVINNPPYNNDVYLDFVELGDEMAKNCSVFITPAKWQAKVGEKNGKFRKNIVSGIKDIVYYPVATDAFTIKEWNRITYYIVNKENHAVKHIENRCKWQPIFNTSLDRELGHHINNTVISILDKVRHSNNFKQIKFEYGTNYYTNKRVMDKLLVHCKDSIHNIQVVGGDSQGVMQELGWANLNELDHQESVNKYKAIMHCMPERNSTLVSDGTSYGNNDIKIINPGVVCKNIYIILKTSDDIQDISYFISYFNTRFIRFLTYCGCIGSQASADEF